MTAPQLFITKLIGGLLIASSDLLAIMPFLSIPFPGALRRLHNFGYLSLIWLLLVLRNMGKMFGNSSTPFPEGTVTNSLFSPCSE
jgi:hypothetical protein